MVPIPVSGGAVCKYPYCRISVKRVSACIPVQPGAARIRIGGYAPLPPSRPPYTSPPSRAHLPVFDSYLYTCTPTTQIYPPVHVYPSAHLPPLQIYHRMARLYRSTPSTRVPQCTDTPCYKSTVT